MFCANCGLRSGEIRQLKWHNVSTYKDITKRKVEGMHGRISTLESDKKKMQKDVARLTNKVDQKKGEEVERKGRVEGNETSSEVKELKSRIRTLEQENNDNERPPIVINVYAGSPGTDNTGDVKASESSNALKNPNINLSNLVGKTGELEYPPANSNSYMAQDMNNTTINDSVEETVPSKKVNDEPVKTVSVDMEGNGNVVEEVKPDEGVSSFISGMGGYNKVRSGKIIPNASYSLLNDTQMEIDEMNNLQI